MAWETSNRRAELPPDWPQICERILDRDPMCMLRYECCAGASAEVDHVGDKHDHGEHNLRGVCSPCHRRRTQRQSAEGQRRSKARARKPRERHPGLIT